VSDVNGCEAIVTVEIDGPTELVVEEVDNNGVSCAGGNDGSATVVATGGTSPYSYDWLGIGGSDDGATQAGLTAGTYTIEVSDANGCTATIIITITGPAEALSATASVLSEVSCNGGADGTATVVVTGGTSPYSYLWSNGSTDQTVTGLVAGTYTVTVLDANGCVVTADAISITEPATPVMVEIVSNDRNSYGIGNRRHSGYESVTGIYICME
jgi:hypothetical protein